MQPSTVAVVVAVAVAVAVAGPSLAAPTASPLARIRAQGELRWAGDLQGGEPFVFRDPRDPSKLIGFEVELAQGLARRLAVRDRFVQNDWHNLVPSLERGDFDIALNGLEETAALRGRILTTRPYLEFSETLVVRRGSALRSLEQLAGKRVGTLGESLAHQLLLAHKELVPVLYEGQEEPYQDLLNGRTEAVLLDSVIAGRYGLDKPGLELADGDVARGRYVIGVRLGEEELQGALDRAITEMEQAGELDAIYARWRVQPPRPREGAGAQGAAGAGQPGGAPDPVDPPRGGFDGAQAFLFLRGAGVTLLVSLLAMALAAPLGLLLALLRLYGNRPVRLLALAYVELFRGTPVLLQLYLLYYGLASFVHLNALSAAVLGLGMNYAAYEAEVHRAAIGALPPGQSEAAAALGLSRVQALRLVLLPQSLRTALPAMTNDLIALLKDSSLVSVITVVELTKQMTITAVEVRGWAVPGLACAGLYFAISWPLSRLAMRLEERLALGEEPGPAALAPKAQTPTAAAGGAA